MKQRHLDKSTIHFGKKLIVLNGVVPAVLLAWDALHHRLGANPGNFAIRSTGFLALIFLILSLAVTPAMKLSGQPWLGNFRRALGLYAFFHTLAHFTLFFWLDRALNVSSTLSEMWLRKYLLVGASALIMMVPLAVTSTNAMIRRLGPKRWKALHRLAYPAGIAGVAHYYMLQKADVRLPIVYASVLGVLLGYRVVRHYLDLRMEAAASRSKPIAAVAQKPKFWKGQLRVIYTFDETPDVRTIRLAPLEAGSPLPFDYKPGQYMNLAMTIDGKPVNRSYTIASSPSRAGYCELTVKREEMGCSSVHLHSAVHTGDCINVSAPAGKFIFDGMDASSIVMIAAGVGITPLMSKLRYLTDIGWPGEIFFIFGARAERDIIFREEIQLLAMRHLNLHVTFTLTRAENGWNGSRGRVTYELLNRLVPNLKGRPIHICGPTQMADETREALINGGVAAEQIEMESFTSPTASKPAAQQAMTRSSAFAAVVQQADVGAPGVLQNSVTFAKSHKSASVPAAQVLLEAAESLGVSIDFDCRSGICGQCKTRLLSGQVTMDSEEALTATDRSEGLILACQAHANEDVVLEA